MTSPLSEAEPLVFWLDDKSAPEALPPLRGDEVAGLAVVGGGYTGLWTALRAKERYPELDIVLLEAYTCGSAASGRNGGFCDASLTHGFANGQARWPDEMPVIERLGRENLDAIGDTIERLGIDCDWRRTGELTVATAPHHVAEMAAEAAVRDDVTLLDQDAVRAEVNSPTYLGGLLDVTNTALVEPARLAWGLRAACLGLGVRIYENTRVRHLRSGWLSTAMGSVRADRIALATNAFPSLLRRLRLYTVPVYDLVLVTEPLSSAQLASIGWQRRQGVGDASNLFHYYRLTRDDRILWGGYTPLYYYGSRINPALEQRDDIHLMLARHFFQTFPQLEGLRFTHRWGGVINTSTRFCAFFGTAHSGRLSYAHRLHRPGRSRHPLRRRRHARPPVRRIHRPHCAPHGPRTPPPLPTRTPPRSRHPPDPLVDVPSRQERRPPKPLAPNPGPPRPRLRLLALVDPTRM
ncbi:FAD-dependent oxidoreductase [Kribbella sp. NPDC050820]|uniref:NAD(P)/FAD-dependent oxidoreductase n=1 Tax=Kribbella sp. NPDC050820 TaxID=3155408 RepID=UPI0033DA5905